MLWLLNYFDRKLNVNWLLQMLLPFPCKIRSKNDVPSSGPNNFHVKISWKTPGISFSFSVYTVKHENVETNGDYHCL